MERPSFPAGSGFDALSVAAREVSYAGDGEPAESHDNLEGAPDVGGEYAERGDARIEDIAHLVGKSVKEIADILQLSEGPASLDLSLDGRSRVSLLDLLADHGAQAPEARFEDLAGELGLTRERVRQIQQEGLERLKRTLSVRGLGRDTLLSRRSAVASGRDRRARADRISR